MKLNGLCLTPEERDDDISRYITTEVNNTYFKFTYKSTVNIEGHTVPGIYGYPLIINNFLKSISQMFSIIFTIKNVEIFIDSDHMATGVIYSDIGEGDTYLLKMNKVTELADIPEGAVVKINLGTVTHFTD